MGEILLNILVAAAILGGAALLAHLFARAMYVTCPRCGAVNARRRSECRKCGETLRKIRAGAA